MQTYSFNGEPANTQTILSMPELQGRHILSIRYDRWRDDEGNDKGGRIDVDTDVVPPENKKYFVPIETPALYADDMFVSSRDIKDDPLEALAEALTETKKGKGEPKSLDMISRSTLKALEYAMQKIDELEKQIKKLEKKGG